MRNLYIQEGSDRWKFTGEAQALDLRVREVLKPLYDEYLNFGYSPIEISHLMQGAILEMELTTVVGWNDDYTGDPGAYRFQGCCSRCQQITYRTQGKVGEEVACMWGGCNGTLLLSEFKD